jgi:hypothetical protein
VGQRCAHIARAVGPSVESPEKRQMKSTRIRTAAIGAAAFASLDALLFIPIFIEIAHGTATLDTGGALVIATFPYLFAVTAFQHLMGILPEPVASSGTAFQRYSLMVTAGLSSWALVGAGVGLTYQVWREWFNKKFLEQRS